MKMPKFELFDISAFNWSTVCGTSKIEIWDESSQNFGVCFQQLTFGTISFSLLIICTAFFLGRQSPHFCRTTNQRRIIKLRAFICFCMLVLVSSNAVLSLIKGWNFYWVDIIIVSIQVCKVKSLIFFFLNTMLYFSSHVGAFSLNI